MPDQGSVRRSLNYLAKSPSKNVAKHNWVGSADKRSTKKPGLFPERASFFSVVLRASLASEPCQQAAQAQQDAGGWLGNVGETGSIP